jgi:hypothetical protein
MRSFVSRALRSGFAVLAVAACSSSEQSGSSSGSIGGCKAEYSSEKGYGWLSDETGCVAAPPPAPQPECPLPTPESVAQQCEAAGAPCDATRFITRDAAICIARAQGLDPGLEPWTATLLFREDTRRPVWKIDSVLTVEPDNCSRGGQYVRIDAITGEPSAIGGWDEIC